MLMMIIYWVEALHTLKKETEAVVAASKEMELEAIC